MDILLHDLFNCNSAQKVNDAPKAPPPLSNAKRHEIATSCNPDGQGTTTTKAANPVVVEPSGANIEESNKIESTQQQQSRPVSRIRRRTIGLDLGDTGKDNETAILASGEATGLISSADLQKWNEEREKMKERKKEQHGGGGSNLGLCIDEVYDIR